MNPVKVFPLKFQPTEQSQSNSPKKRQQPSERNHTLNMSPQQNPALTPSKSRGNIKRLTTVQNPTQEEKIRILTQKKLSLVQQPTSYSPKKRVSSTNEKPNDTFYKHQISDVINQSRNSAPSPTKLPNLKKQDSYSQEQSPLIDLSVGQKRSKRTETNADNTPQEKSKSQLLKLYSDQSPKIRPSVSRAKIGTQTIEQIIPKSIQMHGRSTSQATLVCGNPIDAQSVGQDIIQLFISKTQAGQNGNKQTKTNQDSVIVSNNYGGYKNRYLFAVLDGHGVYGHYVSQLVKRVLPSIIDSQIKQIIGKGDDLGEELYPEMNKMFNSSFQKMTKDLANCGIDITFSGSTCVSVLVSGSNIWCANIGDSRAIFIGQSREGKWQIQELSNDHKPDLPSEKKRILANKGRVQPFVTQEGQNIGPARVWLQHDQIPGLAMSRSFGDYVASTVGVISEPEVIYHKTDSKHGFMVIASDGIWEFITNEEIQKMILQHWSPTMSANKLDMIADQLVREATKRWQEEDEVVDDISVVLAYIVKQ